MSKPKFKFIIILITISFLVVVLGKGQVPGEGQAKISGTMSWTDKEGHIHPIRFAPVNITNIDRGDYITVYTDQDGKYFGILNIAVETNVTVRVFAKSEGFEIIHYANDGSTYLYSLGSDINKIGSKNDVTIDLTASNDTNFYSHIVFSIHDALVMASHYVKKINGSIPASIKVDFPASRTGFAPIDVRIDITSGVVWEWDVIHHEYGHYIQSIFKIAKSKGGMHNSNWHLSERPAKDGGQPRGKYEGIHMAWEEGWATYFAISLQREMNAKSFSIEDVGDTSYHDNHDYRNIIDDLESKYIGDNSIGEDGEVTNARILWDLYDSENDEGDQVNMGDRAIWEAITSDPKITTLDELWDKITKDKSMEEIVKIGTIFTEHKVAPNPISPNDTKAPAESPIFKWERNGGGPNFLNDNLTLEIWSPMFTTQLYASPELRFASTFEIDKDNWTKIINYKIPHILWFVKGRQSDDPETGTYVGKANILFLIGNVDVNFFEPYIESSDSKGEIKDRFRNSITTGEEEYFIDNSVYVFGENFQPNQTYNIYIVKNRRWSQNDSIPPVIISDTIKSDVNGTIPVKKIWQSPDNGEYDIIADVNNNEIYDPGIDALDDEDINHAGFIVISPSVIKGYGLVNINLSILTIFLIMITFLNLKNKNMMKRRKY